jgi:hypothetical protein
MALSDPLAGRNRESWSVPIEISEQAFRPKINPCFYDSPQATKISKFS